MIKHLNVIGTYGSEIKDFNSKMSLPSGTKVTFSGKKIPSSDILHFLKYAADNNDQLDSLEIISKVDNTGIIEMFIVPNYKIAGTGPVPGPGVG
jgi:hypothetical protein